MRRSGIRVIAMAPPFLRSPPSCTAPRCQRTNEYPPHHVVDPLLARYRDILRCVPETRNLLLRLEPELSDRLRAVAEVEGRTVSDVAREAIAELIERRRRDRKFMARLEENVARHERLLRAFRER